MRLNRVDEMFVLAQTDLFSEYRNYLTGVEYCISVLRSQRVRGRSGCSSPCHPGSSTTRWGSGSGWRCAATATSGSATTLVERRAVRWGGVRSPLWVGVPIVVIGYLLVIFEDRLVGHTGNIVLDTTGWVLVWVGIWFPLDTVFFSPLGYGREIHARARAPALTREITVTTWQPTTS